MNHNMNDPRHPWSRLTAAARQVDDDRDDTAPFGFATRVTALAFVREAPVASLLDRFALRAVGVATLLALFSIVLNYSALSTSGGATVAQNEESEVILPTDDAVSIVLDLAD
jgi:hypothetical protein